MKIIGVYRRCGCVDLSVGRGYGARCPRRVERRHGSWGFQCVARDDLGRRVLIRKQGYRTHHDAAQARLVALARTSAVVR
jgi:hypothetical protein